MLKEKQMKLNRIPSLLALLCFFIPTTTNASSSDIYWYLASSMTKPGKELVQRFNDQQHSFQVVLITGGSGQLLAKISSSKTGDLYTPAAMPYVQHVKKIDLLFSVVPFLIQTPVFALSTNGRKKINSWDDLTTPGIRIGLGNPKTMALGKSYEQIKEKMGTKLSDKISANKVVEGVNVSQIINYLKTGIIDAGIAFDSTARANKLQYISIPTVYRHQEIAPLIRLKCESNKTNSNLFTEFIFDNMDIFEKHGFRSANR
jgi:molybdate transport system substrate-binding protein